MVSVCQPSDAFLEHLPSYLGFSYPGLGVSLHACSSKAQLLLLTLDEGYLLTATTPDLQCGMAPLGPPVATQPLLLGRGVVPPVCHPWLWALGSSSRLPPLASGGDSFSRLLLRCVSLALSTVAPDLGSRVAPLGCLP